MAQSFRILELTGSNRIGGVETYLLRLGEFLKARDHHVVFVTRRDTPIRDELTRRGIENHGFYRGGKANLRAMLRLIRLMKSEKIDLVHTHIFSANSIGALAARICHIPSVARVPAIETADRYRKSTYVTAVSKNVARHIFEQEFPAEKLRVFYNGVDTAHFADLPRQHGLRASYDVPEGAFVAVCIASLTARKGQRFLIEALQHLPDTHLILAGEGGEQNNLMALCERLNLRDRVHFTGFRADIRPILSVADAFVLPSSLEGLPNAVLEAQAAGVAVVATDIAGTPEIVRPDKTGLLVPPENSEAIGEALNRLRDGDFRRELAANAQLMVREEFESQRCLEKIEGFFGDAIAAWKNGKKLVAPDLSWQNGVNAKSTRF